MKFAGDYLDRHALRDALIRTAPDPGLQQIVTIPVYNESGLTRCLDSLFLCPPSHPVTEVILLLNTPEGAAAEIIQQNRHTLREVRSWITSHTRNGLRFHPLLLEGLSARDAGVGLARKLAMDEAVRRFMAAGNPHGIMLSLDADTVVEPTYLSAVHHHLPGGARDGCTVAFSHPLSGDDHPHEVYDAVARYELHQRYYLAAVRSTGYPHAFHTVGSAFAVTLQAYCAMGGMNRRQGGEDFYFIQKVAGRGRFSECHTTTVHPSPRPSARVPFGTGPAIRRQLDRSGEPYLTYHPGPFRMLRQCFRACLASGAAPGTPAIPRECDPLLSGYLEATGFPEAMETIRRNVASQETFEKRFWQHFNMFRILKFLHYAAEHGYRGVPVEEASRALLHGLPGRSLPEESSDTVSMLRYFRALEKKQGGNPPAPPAR